MPARAPASPGPAYAPPVAASRRPGTDSQPRPAPRRGPGLRRLAVGVAVASLAAGLGAWWRIGDGERLLSEKWTSIQRHDAPAAWAAIERHSGTAWVALRQKASEAWIALRRSTPFGEPEGGGEER